MAKATLRDALRAKLAEELEVLERAQAATVAGATHEEAKPENDKDTRALEQSYLARGQAARVEEMRAALVEVQRMPTRPFTDDEAIAVGALVTLVDHGGPGESHERRVWLAPAGGGLTLSMQEDGSEEGGAIVAIDVVTTRSPLGRSLLGKHVGDDVEVGVGARARTCEVVAIA